ncbi:MAG: acetoacetate--CoA ligase [Dichotomicrobium sp.]
MSEPLWRPGRAAIENSNLRVFMRYLHRAYGAYFHDTRDLHAFSVRAPELFWSALWDFLGFIGDKGAPPYLIDGDRMPGARFFPDARLNFAENLLRRSDDETALIFRAEDKLERRMSWAELNAQVSRLQQALRAHGVGEGDRVAAILPNAPETIVALLAASSLGAVFSSCSPDFGVKGVMDRFGQIEPKVLIGCDGYYYNGKRIAIGEKLAEISRQLPGLEAVLVADYLGESGRTAAVLEKGKAWDDALAAHAPGAVEFTRLPFDHPVYIMFSSGTTGVPKCIVHAAGGALLQQVKEHALHCDVKAGDRVFYFTTCGWMMWNWLVAGLAREATLMLYDGSPFAPDGNVLFDYADAEGMTFFGTSAKYIDALKKNGLRPRDTHDLSTVRTMASTGSPLVPESFDYVYDAIKPDIHLASISGGTDIVSCFVLGNPCLPVWRGEIQGPGMGMAVDVFDEDGNPVRGEKGELVCTRPFPSMPVGFWNDPDGEKYFNAYFARFPNVWHHGDFAQWTEHGGIVILGRSDATLNPGGVRIGTAEIYRQVEQMPEVRESIVVGQNWDNDVRVVLFVVLQEGLELDDNLRERIRRQIREGATPRHVPAKVEQVPDIPRTKSGKITEIAVREIIHGREIKNREALANPDVLDYYARLELSQ